MSILQAACTCPSLKDFVVDSVPLELGPAYQAYKDGLRIDRKFQPRHEIPQFIIPDCCKEKELETFQYLRVFHICIFTFMLLYVVILVILVVINKNHQPIKFRQADHLAVHLIVQCLPFLLLAAEISANTTAVCSLAEIAVWCLTPLSMIYYISKTVQLDFIYRWSFAKLQGDHKSSKWFFRNKWVMSNKLYYVAISIGFFLGSMVIAGSHNEANVYESGDSLLGTIRCMWWDIPTDYTSPAYPSSFCPCYDYIFAGDVSQDTNCAVAFITICSNTTSEIPPLSNSQTMDLCSSCAQASSSSSAQEQCQDIMSVFFKSGACGFPSSMPNMRTCRSCFYADNGLFIGWMVYTLSLLAIEFGLSIKVRGMSDQLFLRTEIIAGLGLIFPAIIIFICVRQSYDFNDLVFDLFGNYTFIIGLLLILYTLLVTLSGLVPVMLCYYWLFLDQLDGDVDAERRTTLYSIDSSYQDYWAAQLKEKAEFLAWTSKQIPKDIYRAAHELFLHITNGNLVEAEPLLVGESEPGTAGADRVELKKTKSRRSTTHSQSIELLIQVVSASSNISQTNYIGIMTEYLIGSKNKSSEATLDANIASCHELSFALSNEDAGLVYANFSWREFTIENYFFLKAVLKLCQQCALEIGNNDRDTSMSLSSHKHSSMGNVSMTTTELVEGAVDLQAEWKSMNDRSVDGNMKWIVDRFVTPGSSWEINIPSKTRTVLISNHNKANDGSAERATSVSDVAINNPLQDIELTRTESYKPTVTRIVPRRDKYQQIIKTLLPAVVEVRSLIVRDSWARFKNFDGYVTEFRPLYESKHEEEIVWRQLAITMIDDDTSGVNI